LLPAIEIDRGNALAGLHQGNGYVHGGGGFSRSALLTSKYDNVRRIRSICLHQHRLPLQNAAPDVKIPT
jgi:hypothetical protein